MLEFVCVTRYVSNLFDLWGAKVKSDEDGKTLAENDCVPKTHHSIILVVSRKTLRDNSENTKKSSEENYSTTK